MVHRTNPEFAETVGITRSMASRLRSGGRRPSIRIACAILAAYCPPERYAEGLAAFAKSGQTQADFLASIVGSAVEDAA